MVLALCGYRLHPCTIEAPPDAVLDDIEQWLPTSEARAFLEGTDEGKQWVEQHRAGGVWAGIKRLFGRETIDLERLTNNAADFPDEFLKGKKYPVSVDIRAQVPEVAEVAKAPDVAKGEKAAVPVSPAAQMQPVVPVAVPSAAPSPEIVAANKAAIGKSADDIKIKGALEELTVPITCKVPFVGAAVKVLKGDSECSQFVVEVTSLDDFKRADRISAYRKEKGKTPFEIVFKGENENAVQSYVEASTTVRNLESETDALLSQMIGSYTLKKEIERQINDLKSLEELALETYSSADYRYRRIRFKRITLDSKFNDPVINPYVEITEEHKRIARSFFPSHKPQDLGGVIDIINQGGLVSRKERRIAPDPERTVRGQHNSIFLSAGPPYSHLKTRREGINRHNLPLLVFDRKKIYSNPSFRATPRDSFAYETFTEIEEHSLNNNELERLIALLVANKRDAAEVPNFVLKPGRIVDLGTYFPEISVESRIDLEDITNIILTQQDKNNLLSELRESPEFKKLIGKKLRSNSDVEIGLKERFGLELLVPEERHTVDQTYWRLIMLPIPTYI